MTSENPYQSPQEPVAPVASQREHWNTVRRQKLFYYGMAAVSFFAVIAAFLQEEVRVFPAIAFVSFSVFTGFLFLWQARRLDRQEPSGKQEAARTSSPA